MFLWADASHTGWALYCCMTWVPAEETQVCSPQCVWVCLLTGVDVQVMSLWVPCCLLGYSTEALYG